MSENMIKIVDCSTGEEIERELTEQEIKANNDAKKIRIKKEGELEEKNAPKATAKAALLTQLGITAEQAKLLLS